MLPITHRLLWTYKTALWTLIGTAKLSAFSATFYLYFSTVGAKEFCCFCSWLDGFTAACACD
jgi:hypothetical protein